MGLSRVASLAAGSKIMRVSANNAARTKAVDPSDDINLSTHRSSSSGAEMFATGIETSLMDRRNPFYYVPH